MNRMQTQTLLSVESAFETLNRVIEWTCQDLHERDCTLQNVEAVRADIMDILQGKLTARGGCVSRPNPAGLK